MNIKIHQFIQVSVHPATLSKFIAIPYKKYNPDYTKLGLQPDMHTDMVKETVDTDTEIWLRKVCC